MSIFSLFFLASLAASVFALTIDPLDDVVQCHLNLITWTDGVAPFNVSVCPANDPSAPALLNLGTEKGSSCLWTVNLAAGVSAVVEVRDSSGQTAQSSSFTVQAGSENSCLNSSSTDTTTSANAGTTSGTSSPASGSVGAVTSSAAASHHDPVGLRTLAMTSVAALIVALVL